LALAAKNGMIPMGNSCMEYIRFGTGPKNLILLPGLGDGLKTVKGTALAVGLMYRAFAGEYTVWSFSRKNDLPQGYTTRDLAEEIVRKGGCLISEYAPGEELRKWKFIARDRLMARIAAAVIVIQCGKESGTMYTVRAAHRLGRPLACWMPEDTSAGDFGGNLQMAAEYGASPIRIVRDLREFLEKI
jgi:hypothetical protein